MTAEQLAARLEAIDERKTEEGRAAGALYVLSRPGSAEEARQFARMQRAVRISQALRRAAFFVRFKAAEGRGKVAT